MPDTIPIPAAAARFATRPARARKLGGLALLETMIACAIVVLSFGVIFHSMTQLNRRAVLSRIQTNARAIVQRNIDRALSEKFTILSVPTILGLATGGAVWDDDGGGDNKVSIVVQNGTTNIMIPGTLTRTVAAVANGNGADIRRVTFSLAYAYQGKNYTYAASTMRSRD